MSELDFDDIKWSIEMESLFYGDTDGAFFTFDDISDRRKLKVAIYDNQFSNQKNFKVPDLALNERRILSVDVALMASTEKKNNDASSIIINSAIPKNNDSYTSNIIYLKNHEGLTTDELALIVRRMFDWYKCTDLVLDANGIITMPTLLVIIKIVRRKKTGRLKC